MRSQLIFRPIITLLAIAVLFSCKEESNHNKQDSHQQDSSKNINKAIPDSVMQFQQTKHTNGQVKMEGNIQHGLREGKWVSYYEDGMIWSETYFLKGQKNGTTTTWFPNGLKRYTGEFKADKESGKWVFYDEKGKVAQEKTYN